MNGLLDIMTTPAGLKFDRWLVKVTGTSLLNRVFARHAGMEARPALLLESSGRVSGAVRTAVLPYFEDGSNLVIVGSMGGAPADPQWVQNLRARPHAGIYVRRRYRPVHAREAVAADYDRLWSMVTRAAPVYLDYQRNCEGRRRIPLMVLSSA